LQIRDLEYITAAKAIGCSTSAILIQHVGPNILGSLIVVAATELAVAVLLEASLSFLGLGVQPPTPSWGLMLADAKADLMFDPWLMMIPGVCIFTLIFAINVIGDGIRDVIAQGDRL
jgi:peptide/nickel transport system permease protein